jgi:hypothetical protein
MNGVKETGSTIQDQLFAVHLRVKKIILGLRTILVDKKACKNHHFEEIKEEEDIKFFKSLLKDIPESPDTCLFATLKNY